MDTRTLSIGLTSLALLSGAGAWALVRDGSQPSEPTAAKAESGIAAGLVTIDRRSGALSAVARGSGRGTK